MSKTNLPALLLIDLQHDYLNAPTLEPHHGLITAQAGRLLAAARSYEIPVVHVWTTGTKDGENRRFPVRVGRFPVKAFFNSGKILR